MVRERSVTLLITSLVRGGAQKQMAGLAEGLKRRQWKVAVIALTSDGPWREHLEDQGIPVHSLGMRSVLSAPRALVRVWRLLRNQRPQVVVGFLFHAALLGGLAARMARVPRVLAAVRSERMGGRLREWFFVRAGMLRDATVVNSEAVGWDLEARGILRPGSWTTVPNGISVEGGDQEHPREPRGVVRSELGISREDFLWLAVGSLLPAKDYPTLLRAMAALEGAWTLLVAGDGPERGELDDLSRALGLSHRVRFLGDRDDVPRLLRECDAFVCSSGWEGTPNAVMEAMLAGRPVVATAVGGIPELMGPAGAGLLVPPQDPASLSRALARIMRLDLGERWKVGASARDRIHQRHGWQIVLQKWERVLRGMEGAKSHEVHVPSSRG
jgi:glycosyltransferase involved in cell wall biosynthesis